MPYEYRYHEFACVPERGDWPASTLVTLTPLSYAPNIRTFLGFISYSTWYTMH